MKENGAFNIFFNPHPSRGLLIFRETRRERESEREREKEKH